MTHVVTIPRLRNVDFTQFVERYKPLVFRWALGLVLDVDDAEDVAQEVFVSAYRHTEAYRGEGSVEAWLYRITRRHAVRRQRKHRHRAKLAALPAAQATDEVYLTDPGARVDRERALTAIAAAVGQLAERQRAVFDLCDLQGHSPTEAGALLAMKPVTVRAHLFKARGNVRRSLLAAHPSICENDG